MTMAKQRASKKRKAVSGKKTPRNPMGIDRVSMVRGNPMGIDKVKTLI